MWMLAASFLFAFMAAAVKYASADIGTFTLVFYRGVFGVLILGLWIAATGRSLRTPYVLSHLKRSGAGTLGLALWLYCLAFLPLSTGTTLNYTSPLYMSLIIVAAALFRRQAVQWELIVACVVGFIGVVQVLRPEFRAGDFWPAIIGLSSGFFSAIAYLQIKELSKLNEPDWRVVFYFSLFNLVFGAVGHLLFEAPDVYTVKSVAGIVAMGVSATFAQLAMTRSFSSGNLLLSAVLSFSSIIFASVFGVLIFSDTVSLQTYLGIALIVGAGITATVATKRQSMTQRPDTE